MSPEPSIGIVISLCIISLDHSALFAAEKTDVEISSILPEEVEKSWLEYLERRLSAEIQRENQNLKVRNMAYMGLPPTPVYISLNTPYKVECYDIITMGITISFGNGEDSVVSFITGRISDYEYEQEPEIKVHLSDSALQQLNEKLCRYSSDWIAEQMAEKPVANQRN